MRRAHLKHRVCYSWCMQKPKNIAQLARQHYIHNNEWQSGSGKYWKRFEFSHCETQSRLTANILKTAERWGIIRSDKRNKTNKRTKEATSERLEWEKKGRKWKNHVGGHVTGSSECSTQWFVFAFLPHVSELMLGSFFLTNIADKHSSMGLVSVFDYIKKNSSGNSSPSRNITARRDELNYTPLRPSAYFSITFSSTSAGRVVFTIFWLLYFDCSALITAVKFSCEFSTCKFRLSTIIMWLSGRRRRRVAIEIESLHCTSQKKRAIWNRSVGRHGALSAKIKRGEKKSGEEAHRLQVECTELRPKTRVVSTTVARG